MHHQVPLLNGDDPPPFQVFNGKSAAPIVVVCDHAGRAIPKSLGTLGVPDAVMHRHVAYDIGAAQLTRLVAQLLDAPAVLATYSRLVIDCNREPGSPQSIVEVADGTPVPGNVGLTQFERDARAQACHWSYHNAVDGEIERLTRQGVTPALFSIHTFTPSLDGADRQWDLGVLWNKDRRIAVPLIDFLRRQPGLLIGDNEPYSGLEISYTLDAHAGWRGFPNAAVEIRQDHCQSRWELDRWAGLLADALAHILASLSACVGEPVQAGTKR